MQGFESPAISMKETTIKGQMMAILHELSDRPILRDDSNIVSLTSNELADISLAMSKYVRSELNIDKLLTKTISILGEAGIAERILLFQISSDGSKALLNHHWESPYLTKFSPVGFQLDLNETPVFKLFNLTNGRVLQIEDFTRYLSLPNYLFKNKFKALFAKLGTKSLFVTTGSAEKITLVLNLQFCTRQAIWSNEVEKLVKSVCDQLALAVEQVSEKKKQESLERNIARLKEDALREQEELLRKFASDVHDLPCSIIPNLRRALKEKNLEECDKLIDELYKSLRLLINEYVVPDIGVLGFVSAIYQFVNGFRKAYKGKIILELPEEDIDIPQKKAIELFKVIRECFCNIEKHSKATEIYFEIKRLNECYMLITISDNGIGFDTDNLQAYGYGISNMKRRLTEMNASFDLVSKTDKGTTIKIQFCL